MIRSTGIIHLWNNSYLFDNSTHQSPPLNIITVDMWMHTFLLNLSWSMVQFWMLHWYHCLFGIILFCVLDNTTLFYPMHYNLSSHNPQYYSDHYFYLFLYKYDWSICYIEVALLDKYINILVWHFWNSCMSDPVWALLVDIQRLWYISLI